MAAVRVADKVSPISRKRDAAASRFFALRKTAAV